MVLAASCRSSYLGRLTRRWRALPTPVVEAAAGTAPPWSAPERWQRSAWAVADSAPVTRQGPACPCGRPGAMVADGASGTRAEPDSRISREDPGSWEDRGDSRTPALKGLSQRLS